MVSDEGRRLRERAEQTAAAAQQARGWVREVRKTAPSVNNEADSLVADSRQAESLARKMGRAAERRMCVGVFGASQQGKSYLVSVLARPPGASRLQVRFGDNSSDFITEINPQGGKESTGLVTRFTTAHDEQPVAPRFPVKLRLLSETDVIKILANSFQSDFDQNNIQIDVPAGNKIRERIAEVERRRQGQVVAAHLDEVALSELSEYFRRHFYIRWQELSRIRYWDQLVEMGPYLTLDSRAQLFDVLWGAIEDFTRLYRTLAGALSSLNHADEAVTELKALIPRESSIIDIGTLERLGTPADQDDRLPVIARTSASAAAPVQVPRAVLAALVAELRLDLDATPWPMFAHTDLLDFPGARSRLKLSDLDGEPGARARQVRELLVRGKIAYLFQRYAEERELTALLLCMGNKPNEVKDLSSMVRYWLELSHGKTPDARRNVPVALLLVLTMMDLEFAGKAGETDEAIQKKWDLRLHTSLLEPFRHDGWPENFNGRSFNNVFLLRNPHFRQDHLVEYERRADGTLTQDPPLEVGVSKLNRDYIDKLHRAFVDSAQIATHIEDAETAWEAMFKMNDGGASYIAERLAAVSVPSLKDAQVRQRLLEGMSELRESFRRFYLATDDKAQDEAAANLKACRSALNNAFKTKKYKKFPCFLLVLMLSDRDIREIALNVAAIKAGDDEPAAVAVDADVIWGDEARAPKSATPARDYRAVRFGRELNAYWIQHLRSVQQDVNVLQAFGVPARPFGEVVDQLIVASDRMKVIDRLTSKVDAATRLVAARWEDMVDRIVPIAFFHVNSFVAEWGFRDVALAERPAIPEPPAEPRRRIFAPPPPISEGGLPVLPDAPVALELQFFADWGVALLQAGIANFGHSDGRELTTSQNAALGKILDLLSPDWSPELAGG